MKNNQLLKIYVLIYIICMFVSCGNNSPNPPYAYQTNPAFTWGYGEFYGNYYSNYKINNNVITLHLFSTGLSVDKNQILIGTGQYLILEDVFINTKDTILPIGTYTAVDSIIDVKAYTFLKGKEYKEKTSSSSIPSGAYMYYFESDASRNTIKYIVSGNIIVTYNDQNKKHTIVCNFTTKDKKEIKGTFIGELPHFDQSISTKTGVKRENKLVNNTIFFDKKE